MLTKYTSLLAIPFVALVGCGGDDGETPKPKPDAAINNPVDAFVPVACKALDSYGAITRTESYGVDIPANGTDVHYQNIQDLLGQQSSTTVDVINGYLIQDPDGGIFQGGINPTNGVAVEFDRTMDQSVDFYIWPQLDATISGPIPQDYITNEQYLAFAGKIQLTSVGTAVGQTTSGTLSEVQFVHVKVNGNQLMAADDDGMGNPCVTELASFQFTAKLVAPGFAADHHLIAGDKNIGRKLVWPNRK